MNSLDPLSLSFWRPIGTALLCGAIIGLERQLRGKPVGIRTSMLICMATSVFIHLGALAGNGAGDPTRVLGQLVTGIGFLGAGVIISHDGTVSGVTTAAVIWVLSAVGAAIGLGHYLAAVLLALLTVGILTGVEILESSVRRLTRGAHRRE